MKYLTYVSWGEKQIIVAHDSTICCMSNVTGKEKNKLKIQLCPRRRLKLWTNPLSKHCDCRVKPAEMN